MTTDIALAYRDFPATEKWTYMDVAARGLMPRATRDALVEHLDERLLADLDKHAYFEMIERVRGRIAQHLHASADEIAFTKNVTEGIAASPPRSTGAPATMSCSVPRSSIRPMSTPGSTCSGRAWRSAWSRRAAEACRWTR